jgi:hypothetical protein
VAQEAVGGVQVHALRSPHWLVAVVLHEARCCHRSEGVPPSFPDNRSPDREVEMSDVDNSVFDYECDLFGHEVLRNALVAFAACQNATENGSDLTSEYEIETPRSSAARREDVA